MAKFVKHRKNGYVEIGTHESKFYAHCQTKTAGLTEPHFCIYFDDKDGRSVIVSLTDDEVRQIAGLGRHYLNETRQPLPPDEVINDQKES